jgi:hypothetical protein
MEKGGDDDEEVPSLCLEPTESSEEEESGIQPKEAVPANEEGTDTEDEDLTTRRPPPSSLYLDTGGLSSSLSLGSRPSCAICLYNFENHDQVCESNNPECKHVFHEECLASWLLKHKDCPICRCDYLEEQKV